MRADHTATEQCQRHAGRLPLEDLSCSAGVVLDLSASGMRIVTRFPWRRFRRVELRSYDCGLILACEVIWVRMKGIFEYEVGLRFVDTDEAMARELSRIAMQHRNRRTIPEG